MLIITAKEITPNNLGNLNIKGDSNLYDNTGNKIGVVKIELPNCKIEDSRIVIMGFDNKNAEEIMVITKPFHFAEIDKLKFGKI